MSHVDAISARLSLRPPQHDSLEILSRVAELISLEKGSDSAADAKILCEPKRSSEMDDEIVRLKSAAAIEWCRYATEHERRNQGKPWRYALIPNDAITSTATLLGLLNQFAAP